MLIFKVFSTWSLKKKIQYYSLVLIKLFVGFVCLMVLEKETRI